MIIRLQSIDPERLAIEEGSGVERERVRQRHGSPWKGKQIDFMSELGAGRRGTGMGGSGREGEGIWKETPRTEGHLRSGMETS